MKKVVRSIWICALSGLAFLGACCSSRGLSRAEKKKLKKERDAIEQTLAKELTFKEDTGCWGFVEERAERYELMNKLDSINFRLGEDVDLAKNMHRRELQGHLDTLYYSLYNFDNALIYGPPDDMGSYYAERAGRRRAMVADIDNTKKELELLDHPEMEQNPTQRRRELESRLESLRNTIEEREGARVYGSPEVIQEYRRETQRMRQEADSLQQEIKTLEETEEAIKALPVRKVEGRAADVLYGPPTPKRK